MPLGLKIAKTRFYSQLNLHKGWTHFYTYFEVHNIDETKQHKYIMILIHWLIFIFRMKRNNTLLLKDGYEYYSRHNPLCDELRTNRVKDVISFLIFKSTMKSAENIFVIFMLLIISQTINHLNICSIIIFYPFIKNLQLWLFIITSAYGFY